MMFMRHLVVMLDKEDQNWREDTIITMDNALYHTSKESMQLYRDLNLPLMFNPPHGYNVSPVELIFAFLKKIRLNPENLKTGKSSFQNVVYLVLRRLNELTIPTRILLWHHILTHVLRYLYFVRL